MPVDSGPPPNVGLTIGKAKEADIPVPKTLEDAHKAGQIRKHFNHIRAQPWFTQFMLRYPEFQEVATAYFRLVDGMADIGEALHKDFADIIRKYEQEQEVKKSLHTTLR